MKDLKDHKWTADEAAQIREGFLSANDGDAYSILVFNDADPSVEFVSDPVVSLTGNEAQQALKSEAIARMVEHGIAESSMEAEEILDNVRDGCDEYNNVDVRANMVTLYYGDNHDRIAIVKRPPSEAKWYVTSFSEEGVDCAIIAGPVDRAKAYDELAKYTISRLVELDYAKNATEANDMYYQVLSGEHEDGLVLYPGSSQIQVGNVWEHANIVLKE